MSDPRKAARSLNPLVFNLQKLGLELKCSLCLNLLSKSTLLPCDHILCNVCIPESSQFTAECPSCQQQFTDQEIRPAPYMDNLVAIYKNLDAVFSSTLLPMFSADTRTTVSISSSAGQLRKELGEIASENKHSGTSLEDELFDRQFECGLKKIETCGVSKDGNCEQFDRQFECGWAPKADQKSPLFRSPMEKNMANIRSVSEELEMNHAPELTPESSPSDGGSKYTECCNTDPGSGNGCTEKSGAKSCARDALVTLSGEVENKTNSIDTFPKRETKRQKKLCYGSSDSVTQSREDNKDKSVLDVASYMDGSTCAFCHSYEITDGSGPMLHYADGKEVARGETTLSKVIPVHRKCVEWAPKVYYVGESVKNLESELVRAAKLKCSSCGVKGAALGCFAALCCRSYHVPCAVNIPDCRWNCDEFLMLCPSHKSMKFPSENSNSRKRDRGENQPLSTQRSIEQYFWALSPNGPQQWVLCGSALSSEEKHMMIGFASICGAEVYESWNSNVTHMIVATNEKGACSRTLKVLMAILNGRWVLSIDWVKSCMGAKYPVAEETYEVELDNRGVLGGPKTGRLRASNNAPKLFDGLRFYFLGYFVPAYKSGLLALVIDGGGTIVGSLVLLEQIAAQRRSPEEVSRCLVVYNAEVEAKTRAAEAGDLAKDNDARAIPHTWILESVAAHRLLS